METDAIRASLTDALPEMDCYVFPVDRVGGNSLLTILTNSAIIFRRACLRATKEITNWETAGIATIPSVLEGMGSRRVGGSSASSLNPVLHSIFASL